MLNTATAALVFGMSSLADTGAQTTGIVVLGIVLIALAIALIVISQRRRKARMRAEEDAAAERVDAAEANGAVGDIPEGPTPGA